MPGCFVDTSALVKRYHAEVGSARVDDLFARPDNHCVVSRLSMVEIHSVVARRIRLREILPSAADAIAAGFLADVRDRRLRVASVTRNHFRSAAKLLRMHGAQRSIRTLDALQLAVPLDLKQLQLVSVFVVADRQLAALARAEQFSLLDVG